MGSIPRPSRSGVEGDRGPGGAAQAPETRVGVGDAPMGPKEPRSTVLSKEEEALAVAFRRHTLLPLDDCLYALQATLAPSAADPSSPANPHHKED